MLCPIYKTDHSKVQVQNQFQVKEKVKTAEKESKKLNQTNMRVIIRMADTFPTLTLKKDTGPVPNKSRWHPFVWYSNGWSVWHSKGI